MGKGMAVVMALVGVAIVLLAAYFYGKHTSCPPPEWWRTLFERNGTYRCSA
jgi:hypothetical protein